MPSGSIYTLSSIVNHIGNSPAEGHYNLLVNDNVNDSYVLLDDQDIAFDVVLNSKISYILSYTKDVWYIKELMVKHVMHLLFVGSMFNQHEEGKTK